MPDPQEDREMRVGRRPIAPEEEKPKSAGSVGQVRTYDVSPTGNYKGLTFTVSDELGNAIKMAATLEKCSQTELVIKIIKPEVKKIISKNRDRLIAFLEEEDPTEEDQA